MRCPACAHPIPSDSRYCPFCGAALPLPKASPLPARWVVLGEWLDGLRGVGGRALGQLKRWPRHRKWFAAGSVAAWSGFLAFLLGRLGGLGWMAIGIVLLITAQYIREEDQHRNR